jgi:hypothetical protein
MAVDRLRQEICQLFAALGGSDEDAAEAYRSLVELCAKQRKSWPDLADLIRSGPAQCWPHDATLRDRLTKLFAMIATGNEQERRAARLAIRKLLAKHGKEWNVVIELVKSASLAGWPGDEPFAGSAPVADINLIDLLYVLLEQYVNLEPCQYVAVALWILHTHLFDRFNMTPRLGIVSLAHGCGKSTLLDILSRLVAKPSRSDSTTAAAICHEVETGYPTLLLDEADNLGLLRDPTLRAVFNSGHRKGGNRKIYDPRINKSRRLSTFSPLAYCAIGTTATLPVSFLDRSIIIEMHRHDGGRKLRPLVDFDLAVEEAYQRILHWARAVLLDMDPELPDRLRNRTADNWRPLISIADAIGDPRGNNLRPTARYTALVFAASARDEDPAIVVLSDIRAIFDRCGLDRMSSAALVGELVGIDDAMWSEWRGRDGHQQPRNLTQGQLALLLRPFGIRPRTIWRPGEAKPTTKGYLRAWFEPVWARYSDRASDQASGSSGEDTVDERANGRTTIVSGRLQG